MRTKAAVLWEVNKPWSIEDIELDAPKAGEVRVRIAASGLCHSDEHIATGDMPVDLPLVGGHEGAGVVEEVGQGVSWLEVGDHVVFSYLPSCGRCASCSTGHQNLCDLGAVLAAGRQITDGTSRHHARGVDLGLTCLLGTFAHHTVVNEASCVKIEKDVPLDKACLLGCGVVTGWGSSVYTAEVGPGDIVAVVGVGGIGANAIQGARIAGARQIWAIDPVEFKRDKAKEFGATHTAASMADAIEPLGEASWGAMANKVILTMGVGSGALLIEALALAGKRGRVVVTNIHPAAEMSANISLLDLTLMEKQVVGGLFGSGNARADIPKLLKLYRSGQLDLDGLITRTYPLEGVNEGYDDMRAVRNIRGVLVFDSEESPPFTPRFGAQLNQGHGQGVSQVTRYDKQFINGEFVSSTSTETIDVIDSVTEQVMATVPAGTAEDVEKAVAAAKAAFETWSTTSAAERAKYLNGIAAGLGVRMDELADVIARETGMPKALTEQIQVGGPIAVFSTAATLAETALAEEKVGNSLVVREPIGVVGCITPWNFPLHQIAAKVAYALAAGCTVVLKPSEVAPVDAFILAEIARHAGLPPGVFNVVSGTGPVVGEAIAASPDVDMVSFTGSNGAGKRVAQLGAETVKKVALELGGKSANILLEDLDAETFQRAVGDGVGRAFINSGQACAAPTRMLVPRSRLAEAEAIAGAVAGSLPVGSPFTESTYIGPLASSVQRDRVRGYIQKGIDEGATLLAGGTDAPEGVDVGFFIRPTIFSNVRPDMTIAQEEIFGPVLSILPYDDEEDAVRIANGVVYGLAGAVWSADQKRAERVARRLRVGQVDINGGAYNPHAPFGGYKQSGIGREHGKAGLEEFTQIKSMQL